MYHPALKEATLKLSFFPVSSTYMGMWVKHGAVPAALFSHTHGTCDCIVKQDQKGSAEGLNLPIPFAVAQ